MDKHNQLIEKLQSLQLTVLLAEDEEISQLVFKKIAETINCDTTVAVDGKQALELLNHKHYDIIFLDLHMPFYSGYDIISLIKTNSNSINKETPFILVSGTASEKEKIAAFEFGFDELLIKPFTPNAFYTTINKYCSLDFEFEASSNIDLTMISQLYNHEKALIDSLIHTIKLELVKHLAKMEEPHFYDNISLIKDFLHKIRPSFSYLGLKNISNRLLLLEQKLEKGIRPKNLKETCRAISKLTKQTLEELK